EAALHLARLEHPDLILLDWQMPSADGMEVTRRLRSEPDPALRDVPIVLITAQSGPENTAAGFAGGVTDYLTKPFRPAHVRARVQAWLLRRPAEAPPDTRMKAAMLRSRRQEGLASTNALCHRSRR